MKEAFYRGWRTFLQTFLSTLAFNYCSYFTGVDFGDWGAVKPALISLFMSAGAAAISAAMNYQKPTDKGDE